MARVIAITNHKGGTGKTTTAVNMAAALRLNRYDVLLLDVDGQANATQILGVEAVPGSTTYDLLKTPTVNYIQPVRVNGPATGAGVLDIIPAVFDVAALNVELAQAKNRVTRLAAAVDLYRDKYDFIIIDTPPTLGIVLVSALYAADETIITVQSEYLAVRGLIGLAGAIGNVNANRATPLDVHALLTLFDKRKGLHRIIADNVAASGIPLYETKIRQNVAICEAQASNADIFTYNPKSNGAADYSALVAEYLKQNKTKHYPHGYK